jgi:hypothetical protein
VARTQAACGSQRARARPRPTRTPPAPRRPAQPITSRRPPSTCAPGDRVATAALLPRAEAGDWVVVLDAGAYTLSMASRYNSRCSPAVFGFTTSGGGDGGGAGEEGEGVGPVTLVKLRGRETLAQVLAYWNLG